MGRRGRRGAWICAFLALPGVALADEALERAVKAVDLYKLAPFVDWPAQALGADRSPFAICVVGRDPFGPLLDRAAAGQQVADHPVVVRRMPLATPDPPCHIMFIGGSPAQSVGAALEVEKTAPVLTVTDGAATPGIVDYVIDQGRVRFRIDDEAASRHNLSIRAQLLSLAMAVTPRKAGR